MDSGDLPDRNVWPASLADRVDAADPMAPLAGRNDDNQGEWSERRGGGRPGPAADVQFLVCLDDGETLAILEGVRVG